MLFNYLKKTPPGFYVFSLILWGGLLYLGMSGTDQQQDSFCRMVGNWNALILELDKDTEGYRAPISARTIAYIEMAAYEAGHGECHENLSLQQFFPGLKLPETTLSGEAQIFTAVNACYADMLRNFYPNAPAALLREMDALESSNTSGKPTERDKQAIAYGKAVANAFFQWSATDTIGHEAFLRPYDAKYDAGNSPAHWKPNTRFPMPALLPNWGSVSTLFVSADHYIPMPPAPYDTVVASKMYNQAFEIYSLSKHLNIEERSIAEYWGDDHPGLTCTPATRWLAIANQITTEHPLEPCTLLEFHLKLGVALHHAGVVGWRAKYHYKVVRPSAYINACIDPDWQPYLADPSFPSYPSGHAIFAGAAAEVLSSYFPDLGPICDNTYGGEKKIKSRSFENFHTMAAESAYSRLYSGVHFRMDCEEGLRLGAAIGHEAANLDLINPLYTNNLK